MTPPKEPRSESGGAREWRRALREMAPVLGLGTTLAVTVLAGLGAGYWLDERLSTRPVLLLLGGAVGVGAAMYLVFRSMAQTRRNGTD